MDQSEEVSQALERLRDGFDSHDVLDAVDSFDAARPTISDDGYDPPKIRGRLLKLHGMAMELTNHTSHEDRERLNRLLSMADEINDEICSCITNLEKVNDVLSNLLELGRNEDLVLSEYEEDEEEDDFE